MVAAAISTAGAPAHFDEHHGGAVAHDEVELAAAAAEIAFDQDQPMLLQMRKGRILAYIARQLARRAGGAILHGVPGIGAAMPSW
jgi:hypothetical protein